MQKIIKPSVGVRLRERRRASGLSQAKLGQAIGVSGQQIQKYELGTSTVPEARLRVICDRLGVSPLFFQDGVAKGYIGVPFKQEPDRPAVSEDDFLASGEGRRLVDAFRNIKSPTLRMHVLDFIVALTDVPQE